MSKDKTVGPKIVLGVFIAVVFASLGLPSCGGGGGNGTVGGNVQCTGASCPPSVLVPGGIAGCSTQPTTSPIALSLVASRLTGVAPLAVFFDSTATTDASVTSRPFHDLEYRWDFGETTGPGIGSWSTGSRAGVSSRNSATGPVAAHVYENPGIYIIALSIFDGTNTATNTCVRITVEDPDVVFAGANTACIANSTAAAGSGGCPAGAATPAGTADFVTALAACIGNTKRCLFNKGDTFTSNATGTIAVTGPVTIGAYGTGALPVINSTNIAGVLNLTNPAINDLRIIDLDIVGSGAADTGVCVNVGATVTNVAMLRVTCQDIGKGFIIQSGSSITGSVLQDNTIFNYYAASGGNAFFGQATTSALLGNNIGPAGTTAEHGIRLQPGFKVAIANNTVTTPGTSGKQVLTVRANDHSVAGNDTQFVLVSDNKLIGGTGASVQMFQIAPASNSQNDWIYDVIAERNWIVFGSVTQQGLYSEAVRLTVRDNVCEASGGASGRTCFSNDHTNTAGVPTPDDNQFLNNTCYSGDSSIQFLCIILAFTNGPITNSMLKNNLGYAPSATTSQLLLVGSGVTGTIGAAGTFGNSSDSQVKNTDPLFTSVSPFNPTNAKPTGVSYAIGGGVSVPVWSDFFLTTEPSPRDMGAVNH